MIAVTRIPTETRVLRHTKPEVNDAIRRQLEANLAYFARNPEQIDRRLYELEQEWDIERMLEANAGIVALATFALGRMWWPLRIMPAVVAGFLVQHAVQGWCPPLPVFRRLGVRTTREINHERFSLKALRGDFGEIPFANPDDRARAALRAAELSAPSC